MPTWCVNECVFQKLPEISIELMCGPGRECSIMKSSAKDSLLARDLTGLILEESALRAFDTGLDESRMSIWFATRRFLASHFFSIVIASPAVPLRT